MNSPRVAMVVAIILFGLVTWCFSFQPNAVEQQEQKLSLRNLHRIGLAIHSFNDRFKQLPPADGGGLQTKAGIIGKGLSWRVHLLAFIGEEKLHEQFDWNQPWDGVKNSKLLQSMPAIYRLPGLTSESGYTHYRVFTGKSIFGIMESGQRWTLRNTVDPLSETLLVVETGDAVPWTKPDEPIAEPARPLPRLKVWPIVNGFHVLTAGGEVSVKPAHLGETSLRRAIDPGDGKPPGLDWSGRLPQQKKD